MSEVWKIGQKSASEVYDNLRDGKCVDEDGNVVKVSFLRGDVWACNQMAKICDAMRADYENVIKDENDYLSELEALNTDLNNEAQTLEEKIKTLQDEIHALQEKVDNGTATDEEKEDLAAKQEELTGLLNGGQAGINAKADEFESKNTDRRNAHKNKTEIAEDYGNTTVEKGTPLAETKVSHGFFKKLFGKTGKNKKKAGERAVEAGNALLDKVKESSPIEAEITAYTRKK